MAAGKKAVTVQTNYRGYESAPSPAYLNCRKAKTTVKDVTPCCDSGKGVDSRPLKAGGGKANTDISNPKNH